MQGLGVAALTHQLGSAASTKSQSAPALHTQQLASSSQCALLHAAAPGEERPNQGTLMFWSLCRSAARPSW